VSNAVVARDYTTIQGIKGGCAVLFFSVCVSCVLVLHPRSSKSAQDHLDLCCASHRAFMSSPASMVGPAFQANFWLVYWVSSGKNPYPPYPVLFLFPFLPVIVGTSPSLSPTNSLNQSRTFLTLKTCGSLPALAVLRLLTL